MSFDIGFLIKNLISTMLMPLSIGLILALLSLLYLYRNQPQKAKKFLIITILWIGLLSYRPLSYFALQPLESAYPQLEEIPKDINYILLLGGDKNNRTWEGLRLYHKIPHAKIITSGFNGQALFVKQLLIDSGVPAKDILMQSQPKDTKEEAIAIKKRLGKTPFILVTSAYHMPRSMAIFKTEGLNPTPAPTDFQKENLFASMPSGRYLKKMERAWHEYIGLLWMRIKY
jgi:uncharacterized SAM-binding protein YcdF (DUF218 family)